MSTIKVDTITSSDGLGAPELPYGLAISAAFTLNGTGNAYINRSVNSGSLTFAGGTGIDAGQTSGGLIARGSTDSYNAGGVEVYSGGSERLVINSAGSVGIGTDALTDNYKTIIEGSDQETANLTDAGAHGATLFLRATGENVGSGGAVAFGTTYGNQRPFAAIKGFITDGTANSVGDLAFSTRANVSDTNLTERMRITSTGVGIGASSPAAKLQIDNTAASHSLLNLHQLNTSYNTDLSLFNQASTTSNTLISKRTDGGLWLYQSGADYIAAYTNGSERMRIRADGNTSLNAGGSANTTHTFSFNEGGGEIILHNAAGGQDILFDSLSGYGRLLTFNGALQIGTVGANELIFNTGDAERARFDNAGNFLLGTTTSLTERIVSSCTGGVINGYAAIATTTATATAFVCRNNTSVSVGTITFTTTATSYNTSSDERLKENITDAPAGNIDDIKVRSFDWKADGSHQDYGMIAQELEAVAPYAVSKGETEDDMWSVDYSKLVPMLIKEIQDLKAEVAALKGAN